jgi:hypothetical protein
MSKKQGFVAPFTQKNNRKLFENLSITYGYMFLLSFYCCKIEAWIFI